MTPADVLEILRACDRIILLIESRSTGCIHEQDVTLEQALSALQSLPGSELPSPRIERAGDQRVATVGPVLGD